MRKNNEIALASSRRTAVSLCLARIIVIAAMVACSPAISETRRDSATPEITQESARTPKGEKTDRHLSKFEARHIRQGCRDRTKQSGITPADRSAFLTNCFRTRVSGRGLWNECKRQAGARGLDKPAMQEFARACVAERLRQKVETER
jgi:hypothetical protein